MTSCTSCRTSSIASSGHDLLSNKASSRYEEWHSDLLGCCSEPFLCMPFSPATLVDTYSWCGN